MSLHLQRELDKLRKQILALGALVENNVCQAVRALETRDARLAEQAMEADNEVDAMEIAVEEECLKILALHQPVAVDLRFIVAVLKMNNDLERIGDQAANIARKALRLASEPALPVPFDFARMSGLVRKMLKETLDAIVNLDSRLAVQVRASDDEVDRMKHEVNRLVCDSLQKTPARAEALMAAAGAARNLERIADLATNIAEDLIYMIEGEIVRHGRDEQG